MPLVNSNNDDDHYEELVKRQVKNDKNHDASRNYASIQIGTVVMVQQDDGWPWTHGTGVGGQHNHNSRSYTIHVTKTGQLITRKSKHIITLITAEQYLWDQLNKNIRSDTVEDTLNNLKNKQYNIMYTCNKPVNKIPAGNDNSDTQQANMQQDNSDSSSQERIAVNNEQKDNINEMPLWRIYGIVIRKPDRLTY